MDIHAEHTLTLSEAARALPSLDGRRPHISTLWRWCRRGLRGVRLDYGRIGRRIVTSKEALARFARALAELDDDEARARDDAAREIATESTTETRREREIAAAERELDRLGV